MFEALKKSAKKLRGTEIASRSSDPNFYGTLQLLPNPDTILRKMDWLFSFIYNSKEPR